MSQRGCCYSESDCRTGGGGSGGLDSGQLYTLCSFTAKLLPLVLCVLFVGSSRHVNLRIPVVHLSGKDGDVFFCVE